jgi:hypothetical protein
MIPTYPHAMSETKNKSGVKPSATKPSNPASATQPAAHPPSAPPFSAKQPSATRPFVAKPHVTKLPLTRFAAKLAAKPVAKPLAKPAVKTASKASEATQCEALEQIPNIGPALADDLRRIGVRHPRELANKDAFVLYQQLCAATGQRHDPCVLDTFMAATDFMRGAPAVPWWHYTAHRKALYGQIEGPFNPPDEAATPAAPPAHPAGKKK